MWPQNYFSGYTTSQFFALFNHIILYSCSAVILILGLIWSTWMPKLLKNRYYPKTRPHNSIMLIEHWNWTLNVVVRRGIVSKPQANPPKITSPPCQAQPQNVQESQTEATKKRRPHLVCLNSMKAIWPTYPLICFCTWFVPFRCALYALSTINSCVMGWNHKLQVWHVQWQGGLEDLHCISTRASIH